VENCAGAAQFLVIPTAKITGIEDPAILAPDAPNYFALAWRARKQVAARLKLKRALPRDAVSLGINATTGRQQNQLHIHVDCIKATVRAALHGAGATIGPQWAPLPVLLAGHPYQAMRVAGKDLDAVNPFRLLATGMPGAAADMGHHTLVVTGTTMPDGQPGFILLDDHTNSATGDFASGEELQDHACNGLSARRPVR
jgi:CDP-diacylglycerol pyrophosphatase